ncbi:MAG: biopolymer transporter ExbD [Puniceicoccales bacterium]|nr:biopolymer transporter ExbD [Puniceicoccales bacterium]
MSALSEINVTPLLDLCFCLLIIFMIATPVLEQTTQIDLPTASKAIATPAPADPVKPKVLTLDRHAQITNDGRATHEAELREELLRIATLPEASQPRIRIRADGALPCKHLWHLFSLVKKCGLTKVNVDTEVED